MKQRKNKPVTFGVGKRTPSETRRPKMSSRKFETKELTMSWGNIEDALTTFLYAFKAIPENMTVLSVKLGSQGPWGRDKIVPVTLILRKEEVKVVRYKNNET